mmetsp:Transcript_67581/g.140872  ORF Transcript_67581/g.140872 Transcript_67581/m.140872 type:complete len:151 (+) Transcript_67581:10-462(+)|eukprot:CAMPEP_0181289714 /NCGR_PEP_ID=MMETSP1101-20121128/1028_1 /TAXON_ID=46948 /ORGANISM="Rhodomonas abbreviata, Strain Caron Lab Isolate" /LENGTH=150 /DNA_ID=CAMNT_0023393951 /DNA_START=8 /DNA_END=460 /DNA_ORIENTATION=+
MASETKTVHEDAVKDDEGAPGESISGFFTSVADTSKEMAGTLVENTKTLFNKIGKSIKGDDSKTKESEVYNFDLRTWDWSWLKSQGEGGVVQKTAVDTMQHVKLFFSEDLPNSGRETIEFLFKNGGPGGEPESKKREVLKQDIEERWNFV